MFPPNLMRFGKDKKIEFVSPAKMHDKEIKIEVYGLPEIKIVYDDAFLRNTVKYFDSLFDAAYEKHKDDYDFFWPEIRYMPSFNDNPHKMAFIIRMLSLTPEQKEERLKKDETKTS